MTSLQQTDEVCLGSINRVSGLLEALSCDRVFLVADPQAYEACGAKSALADVLDDYDTVVFSRFEPNPQWLDVAQGIDLLQGKPCDAILAVGGGTAIDIAKLIGVLSCQTSPPPQIIAGTAPITRPGPPLIAIPTTAGTGSEATHFAVVYMEDQKYSLAHEYILPRFSVVDPALTYSLPPKQTAATGLDAFAQAMESLWSIHSTETSSSYAARALSLAFENLSDAVNAPSPPTRLAMSIASHLGGKAINITKTTAPHALSYAMTSQFGVPHGIAVALTLGEVLIYNSEVSEHDVTDARGVDHVKGVIGKLCRLVDSATPRAASDRMAHLLKTIGCPTRLHEVGIKTDAQRQGLSEQVNVLRLANNPRVMKKHDLDAILHNIA